jgi:hypothetical protein
MKRKYNSLNPFDQADLDKIRKLKKKGSYKGHDWSHVKSVEDLAKQFGTQNTTDMTEDEVDYFIADFQNTMANQIVKQVEDAKAEEEERINRPPEDAFESAGDVTDFIVRILSEDEFDRYCTESARSFGEVDVIEVLKKARVGNRKISEVKRWIVENK